MFKFMFDTDLRVSGLRSCILHLLSGDNDRVYYCGFCRGIHTLEILVTYLAV